MSHLVAVPSPDQVERATVCGRCDREVVGPNEQICRLLDQRPVLSEADYCRWCARPISERAERRADNAAFIRLARMILGDRAPALPTGPMA